MTYVKQHSFQPFQAGQDHYNADVHKRRKTLSGKCPSGQPQIINHTVHCTLSKHAHDGLIQLHFADDNSQLASGHSDESTRIINRHSLASAGCRKLTPSKTISTGVARHSK